MSAHLSLLVIEDSREDIAFLLRAFRKLSFQHPVHTCETADLAWSRLTSQDEGSGPLPSVILLDLNLPGVDGRVFLKRLKAHETLGTIPVVILSSSRREDDIEFCYRHGAAAYHAKLMDTTAQLEVIRRLLDYWFGATVLPGETGP